MFRIGFRVEDCACLGCGVLGLVLLRAPGT